MSLFKKTTPTDQGNEVIGGDSNFVIRELTIPDSWMYGSFRTLAKPSMLYYDGSTYSLYYKENTDDNAVGIIKQTGNSIEYASVNNGTVLPNEPTNHPAPMLHINKTTGYIYVIQNEFHVDNFRVWKSDFPKDISSFSLLGSFGNSNCAYLGHLSGDESDVVLLTRAGQVGVDNYSISVIEVNLDTLVYTQTQVTDVTGGTDMRHYLLVPYQYGTSTRTYFGVTTRNQPPTGTGYYKFSLMATTDFDTFTNIPNTYSKNVVSTSPITTTELETNFASIGSDSARTTIISEGKMIVLNDDIYVVWMSDDPNSRFSVRKFTWGSGTTSDFLIPVTTIVESPIWYGPVYMRYNGTKFVFTIIEHDGVGGYVTKLYTCDTDFSNWAEYSVDLLATSLTPSPGNGYFYGMPTNLHDAVLSGDKYLCIGKKEGQPKGTFHYAVTEKTWND